MSCSLLPLLTAWTIPGLTAPDIQHFHMQLDSYGPVSIKVSLSPGPYWVVCHRKALLALVLG